jgi:transcriptional regulator with PAS, ATPase and Fis domain
MAYKKKQDEKVTFILNQLDEGIGEKEIIKALQKKYAIGASEAIFEFVMGVAKERRISTHTQIDHFLKLCDNDIEEKAPFLLPLMAILLENNIDLIVMCQAYDQEITWSELTFEQLTARDPAATLKMNMNWLYQLSICDEPLLIVGETGTGKQSMARVIHNVSRRRGKVFNELNCAALPEALVESAIFGHEKGAFTGASSSRKGLIEESNGGTIFLDELAKMPLSSQGKLLKFMDSGEYTSLGGNTTKKADIRFIAATQPAAVKENKILEDILYRLGYPDTLSLLTLNERMKQLGRPVVDLLLENVRAKHPLFQKITLSDDAYEALFHHNYQGNYRELNNILRGAFRRAFSDERSITTADDIRFAIGKAYNDCNADQDGMEVLISKIVNSPVKDIVELANNVADEVVRMRVVELYKKGGELRATLKEESDPGVNTQSCYKKIRNIVKSIEELKKSLNTIEYQYLKSGNANFQSGS